MHSTRTQGCNKPQWSEDTVLQLEHDAADEQPVAQVDMNMLCCSADWDTGMRLTCRYANTEELQSTEMCARSTCLQQIGVAANDISHQGLAVQ